MLAKDKTTSDMFIKQLQTQLQLNENWGDTVTRWGDRHGKRVQLKITLPEQPDH